ncbi:MAG: response regulator [Granulosicoccus sp.]
MADPNEIERSPSSEQRYHQQLGPPRAVLLVDDSHRNRKMARDVLGKAGIRVITAADGFDGLSKVVAHQPSVVLIDTVLPRLDGYQACALIKNNLDFHQVRVILLSGGGQPLDNARARLVGCDAQLTKPLARETLLAAVLQRSDGETASEEDRTH